MGLKDGLSSLEVHATTFSGTTVDIGSSIGTNELEDNACSGIKVDGTFGTMADNNGAFGRSLQAGSAIASDVAIEVTFGTAFADSPYVVVTPGQSGTLTTQSYVSGNADTASFSFFGQSGLIHNWIAIGSGRV